MTVVKETQFKMRLTDALTGYLRDNVRAGLIVSRVSMTGVRRTAPFVIELAVQYPGEDKPQSHTVTIS